MLPTSEWSLCTGKEWETLKNWALLAFPPEHNKTERHLPCRASGFDVKLQRMLDNEWHLPTRGGGAMGGEDVD